jgi:hypothetical protein
MYRAQGKLDLAAQFLQRSLVAANTPAPSAYGAQAGGNVPPGWETAMSRIGSNPLPGTNPFEGKTAVDTASNPALASGASYRQALPQSYTQPVPNYLPPPQPAPYTTPYVAPSSAPAPQGAPRPAASGGYGPDMYGSGQSGAPLQPYPGQDAGASGAYPAQPYQQAPAYQAYPQQSYQQQPYPQQPYPQQGYPQQPYPPQQPYAAQDPYASPWPMSPGSRNAQSNTYAPPAAASAPSAKRSTSSSRKASTARPANAYAYGAPPQQPYAQAPYGQQPQPYAPQPYYPQQPYAPQYAQQPYIPQPPAGYAQPYYPAQAQAQQRAAAAATMTAGGMPAPVANSQTAGVAEELAQINREQASTISGGLIFRSRDGEDGLSNLTDIEAPIEGRIKAGNGHVIVRATPVTLDAGTAASSQNTLARFGSGQGAATTPPSNNYGSQTATGVGLSLGYENRNFKGDVGTTPLGFRETNVVGGLQYQNAITDKVSYSLAVARRAVTDSLLSYAGARDAGAGLEWGGVTSTGARADLGWDDGTSGVYLNAAYQFLDGNQVASNNAVKGGGGIYTRLLKDADQTLTVGANTTLMHYDKNLSYFTYGQGGYFSPQQYVILNFPVEYMGRAGLFTYDLKGSVGVQYYRENSSNYFPTDSTRQAQAASSGLAPDAGAVYPSQSKTGVSYSINATGEYQLAPQLAFGATASFGNAYQYREWLAAVYVRYSFTRQGNVQPVFPPQAFSSPYLSLSN